MKLSPFWERMIRKVYGLGFLTGECLGWVIAWWIYITCVTALTLPVLVMIFSWATVWHYFGHAMLYVYTVLSIPLGVMATWGNHAEVKKK